MLLRMGNIFGERLKRHREDHGLSGYRICQVSGMQQAIFIAIEKGRRPPSDANLEALAAVPELGVTLEQLQAWRDLDRIGVEGIERIKRWMPEVLEGAAPREISSRNARLVESAEATRAKPSDVLSQVPEQVRAALKPSEVKALQTFEGMNLEEVDLGPGAYVWTLPAKERLLVLKQAAADWREANEEDGAFDPGNEKNLG